MTKTLSLAALLVAALGCQGAEDASTPPVAAPAATGPGGVPMLSPDQLAKLPPEKQEQVKKDQAALAQAAGAGTRGPDGRPGG